MNRFINMVAGISFVFFINLLSVHGLCEEPNITEMPVDTAETHIKAESEANAPAEAVDTIEALVGLLLAKGVINEKEAATFMERYRSGDLSGEAEGDAVRIIPEQDEEEYFRRLTENADKELKEDVSRNREDLDFITEELRTKSSLLDDRVTKVERQLSDDINEQLLNSAWAGRIEWGGDIRARYQKDFYDEDNYDLLYDPDANEIVNTTVDRSRYRYRIRLTVEADVMNKGTEINAGEIKAGARLASGNTGDPISTNDTMGDYLNKDTVTLDRAYLKWTYKPTYPKWGLIPRVTAVAGRFASPWFSTDLVWDSDVNFEGMALTIETDTLLEHPLKWFVIAGAFPVQELELFQEDKWLFGWQLGMNYEKPLGLSARVAAAYYNFEGTSGEFFDDPSGTYTNETEPLFRQVGNSLFDINTDSSNETWALAAEYKLMNLTAELDYARWFPFHIILTGDYVKNIGFDREEVSARMGYSEYPEETTGYQAGLTVGYPTPRGFGEWNASLFYRRLGADSVLDAFTDSDFWLGGTNTKGWILGGQYGLSERFWLAGRWMSANEILGVPLAVDTFMFDLNARF
ncbi:MAG: putative porin [Deltaproteobacteria bacterium]|nr:putative porin [Deltaproteobacteria bacterium]